MTAMWKTGGDRERMREWHQHFRALIETPLESRTVSTSHGETHVLIGGPETGCPVVVLHGAMASSAHVLLELQTLLRDHRVYAIDIVGQSAMSADRRLRVDDNTAGHWLREVFDQLAVSRAPVIGVSWGGFVAQRFAAVAPERLTSLVLLVPAGLVSGPWWTGFKEMGWPMTRYLLSPTPRNRDALLSGLLTTPDDPHWAPFIAEAFLAANLRTMRVPRLSREGEFSRLACPVHVIGADRDVSFPGTAVVERARQLFPTLRTAEVLTNTRHSPPTTPAFRESFGQRIREWIAGGRD